MADLFNTGIDLFLHLDRYLGDMIQYFGIWTYVLLFLIIFCETGLVVTPILPGDSLLFGGYFFGNFKIIKNNFTLVIIAIVILSVLPGVIEYIRQRKETNGGSGGGKPVMGKEER
jgi:membrane-associated protein